MSQENIDKMHSQKEKDVKEGQKSLSEEEMKNVTGGFPEDIPFPDNCPFCGASRQYIFCDLNGIFLCYLCRKEWQ